MMFRYVCAIFLLTAFLFQPLHTVYVYLDYEFNKNYITLRYCENKKTPQLKCHGKCQAMKKLNGAEKQELPKSASATALGLVNYSEGAPVVAAIAASNRRVIIPSSSPLADGHPSSFHRPPAA